MDKSKIIKQHIEEGWSLEFEGESYLKFSRPKPIDKPLMWVTTLGGVIVFPLLIIPVILLLNQKFGKRQIKNIYGEEGDV